MGPPIRSLSLSREVFESTLRAPWRWMLYTINSSPADAGAQLGAKVICCRIRVVARVQDAVKDVSCSHLLRPPAGAVTAPPQQAGCSSTLPSNPDLIKPRAISVYELEFVERKVWLEEFHVGFTSSDKPGMTACMQAHVATCWWV